MPLSAQIIQQNEFKQSIMFFRNALLILALIGFGFQVAIDYSFSNIFSNVFALASFAITCIVIFQTSYPKIGSAFAATIIFLIVISNTLISVIGTLLDGNSLITGLLIPVETFFHRFVFTLALLGALIISRSNAMLPARYGFSKIGSLVGTNLFLTVRGVIGLGMIGLACLILKRFHLPGGITKFLDGFEMLLWAPFILIVPPYSKLANAKWIKWFLIVLYIVLAGISLASNSRMGMVAPVAVIASVWIVALLLGKISITMKMLQKAFLLGIAGLFILGIFVDLSYAILVSRESRGERSVGEQFQKTIQAFNDKEALENYKLKNAEYFSDKGGSDEVWLEAYVSNPFLQRFIQIKFDDNCFYRVNTFDLNEKALLKDAMIDKVLVLLPTPLLELLDIKLDKIAVNSYSMGDLIDYIYGGGTLGHFVVGSLPAHAYAVFGWWYPVVMMAIYTIIFIIFNGLLSVIDRDGKDKQLTSTLGLVLPFSMFFIIAYESVSTALSIIVRGAWQILLVYWIALWILRLTGVIGFLKESKMSREELLKESLKNSRRS